MPHPKLAFNIIAPLLFICIILTPCICNAQGAGRAIELDGVNDYAEFGNNNRGITSQLTVEAWIKTSSLGHHHIVSKYNRDSENGFQLLIQNGKACLAGRDGSGNYRLSGYSTTIVADGNWHHLAGVVHEGVWMIFVDGILQNQFASGYANPVLNNSESLLLGNYYYPQLGNHFYKGVVDEVRIWKRALSADEIRQNMCRTLPATAPDLVAYFKLDNIAGGVIADHSDFSLHGWLMNTSPSVAAVTSGAAIGDISTYLYTDVWSGKSISLQGLDGNEFLIDSVGAGTAGLHIYHVNARPNFTQGIPAKGNNNSYFGIFTPLSPATRHKINYAAGSSFCAAQLYERRDNTVTAWSELPAKLADGLIMGVSSVSRGEYVATVQTMGEINITGPSKLCEGDIISLAVATVNPAGYSYLWSTGAATSSIEVGSSGEYWVEVTNSAGCTVKDSITVTVNPQPDTPLKEEIIACYGEEVLLDASTANASYLWSNGQTSASIKVAAPAEMRVAITVAGCTYTKIVSVVSDECPIIPNIITPNGDGKNDTFVALGIEENTMQLHIFDRLGKSVYQAAQYDNSWSAMDMPAGTYYYQFTSPRTQRTYKGWVEVVR